MGDDERLAEVQHEVEPKASPLERFLVYVGIVAVVIACWSVIIYGVARAIDMRGH